jgi:hypothetical protein
VGENERLDGNKGRRAEEKNRGWEIIREEKVKEKRTSPEKKRSRTENDILHTFQPPLHPLLTSLLLPTPYFHLLPQTHHIPTAIKITFLRILRYNLIHPITKPPQAHSGPQNTDKILMKKLISSQMTTYYSNIPNSSPNLDHTHTR